MATLLTPDQIKALPDGSILKSISGKSVIKGKNRIDMDTRFGVTAYSLQKNTIKNKVMKKHKVSKKAKDALKKVISKAQRIHKAQPRKKWANCMKDAAK